MSRRKERQPLETKNYKELWLFSDEARTWLATHKPSTDSFAYDRMMRQHFRAEFAVNDGWGIVVSFWKTRPDDQICSRIICPKCKHELRANQRAWAFRHEKKCNLPTQSKIGGYLGDAFNVFSAPGFTTFDGLIAKRICRAFAVFQEISCTR